MQIWRIDIAKHHVVTDMMIGLRTICRVPSLIEEKEKWLGISELSQVAGKSGDQPRPKSYRKGFIGYPSVNLPSGWIWQCANYFGPGHGMNWHTDSGIPGWRVYLHRYTSGAGRMFYGQKIIDERVEGAYLFDVGSDCWHAVESAGDRFSIGVQLGDRTEAGTIAGIHLAREIQNLAGELI